MKTPKPRNPKPSQPKPTKGPLLSTRKLWLFRIIALILVPILLLSVLECSLRLSGYGYSTKAVIQYKVNGKDACCHNYQFGWRFFPRNIARNFDGFVFDAEKPPQTYRIFLVGASAAMGMPAPAYNVGRILEVMLNDMYPETQFEVHTVAMVAINSHAVLEIVKDCAGYNPDLFIVYLGNNEVVGPFGPGTVFSPLSQSLPLIRANIAAKSTRTGQLLENAIGPAASISEKPQRWAGLEMFLEKQVRHDSPDLQAAYHHFEQNLRDICTSAKKSGTSVIVSNIGVNLKDSPPFASLHRTGLTETEEHQWNRAYKKGIDHEVALEYSHAIESYQEAAAVDETYADLQFRLGRCYLQIGNDEKAKISFQNALQYDTVRFRADGKINTIIRDVAENRETEKIYFADSVTFIEQNSPHLIPGGELFYEHVHFNFKGNYVLAKALLPVIQKTLPTSLLQHQETILTEKKVAESLAYTHFDRHTYLNQLFTKMLCEPPFTNQLYHDEFMADTEHQIESLALKLQGADLEDCRSIYQHAIEENPDSWHLRWRYAYFLDNAVNDAIAQQQQLREVIRRCPYDAAYLALGKNLHKQGNVKEAKEVLYRLLEFKPGAGRAHVELASIYKRLKDNRKYIEHLSKSLEIDPTSSIEPYGALAQAYEKIGKIDQAIKTMYRATYLFPESETAHVHASLSYLLNSQGQYDKALKELNIALKINPDFANDQLFQSLQRHLKAKVKTN